LHQERIRCFRGLSRFCFRGDVSAPGRDAQFPVTAPRSAKPVRFAPVQDHGNVRERRIHERREVVSVPWTCRGFVPLRVLVQEPDDLRLSEPRLLHCPSLCVDGPHQIWSRVRGSGQMDSGHSWADFGSQDAAVMDGGGDAGDLPSDGRQCRLRGHVEHRFRPEQALHASGEAIRFQPSLHSAICVEDDPLTQGIV
jgi:hypothetical protein